MYIVTSFLAYFLEYLYQLYINYHQLCLNSLKVIIIIIIKLLIPIILLNCFLLLQSTFCLRVIRQLCTCKKQKITMFSGRMEECCYYCYSKLCYYYCYCSNWLECRFRLCRLEWTTSEEDSTMNGEVEEMKVQQNVHRFPIELLWIRSMDPHPDCHSHVQLRWSISL